MEEVLRLLHERSVLCRNLSRQVEALEASMAAVSIEVERSKSLEASTAAVSVSPAKTIESARDEDSDDDANESARDEDSDESFTIADAPISSGSFVQC